MRFFLSGVLAALVAGCNYNHVKIAPGGDDAAAGGAAVEMPDYKTIQAMVIAPKCLGCHSNAGGNRGGTNLEDYAHVRALYLRIQYRSLVAKDMPPNGGLSGAASQTLQNWIDAGVPETVVVVGEKPDPSLGRGPATWEKVRDKIFAKKCADCHGGANPAAGLDTSDVKQIRAKILAIVDRVKVKHDMPLAPYAAVTPKEQTVISAWIDMGMAE